MSATSKTFLLLSCTFLGLICGTLYLYSSYSPQLAAHLKYSATDSSQIALFGSIGVAVSGPVAGRLVDLYGYTLSLILGGSITVISYWVLKIQYDHIYTNVTLSTFLIFMIGCGSTLMNSACLKCCAVNFPSIRGVATALPLALYGLSALFYSVIASTFYPGDSSGFLGFLSISSAVVFIIFSPKIIFFEYQQSSLKTKAIDQELEMANLSPRAAATRAAVVTRPVRGRQQSSHLQPQIGGKGLFKSKKFWFIFFITGILAAVGQMYIYSVGYMIKALVTHQVMLKQTLGNEIDTAALEKQIQVNQQFQVGLISIANFIGRISAGVLGDIITQSLHKPRSWLLFLPATGMFLTQFMGYTTTEFQGLSLISSLVGFFYGFTFCIMPIIVGDTFGLDNFSLNWGCVGLAPIILSYYFIKLFGRTYDFNSTTSEFQASICLLGSRCYNSVFQITMYVTALAFILVLVFNFGRRRDAIVSQPLV